MTIKFYSSKGSNERRTIYTKIDNIKIMIDNETDKIIEELWDSLLQRN